MPEVKLKPTGEDISLLLNAITDPRKRQDSFTLLELMRQVAKVEPKLWASSMVGFGDHHYKYASGHEGDTFIIGFAPRKQELVLYGLLGFVQDERLLGRLGKYKAGKGCIYIKHLEDIDLPTLRDLIQQSFDQKVKRIRENPNPG